MSETKHSPEPWHYVGDSGAIEDDKGALCAEGWGADGLEDLNARRIVACVNACAGIPTEALEAGRLPEAVAALADLVYCADCWDNPQHNVCEKHLAPARAALRRLGRLP